MKTSRLHKGIFAVVSALFFLYMLTLIFPFVWMLLNSLKTNMDFFKDIWSLPEKPLLSNYVNVWDQMNLLVYFGNSIKLTLLGTLASILTASMASYVIAKYKFKLSKLLYTMAIVVMLIPSIGTIAALYKFMISTHLFNTHLGLVLLYSGGFGFNFILLYGFFKSVSWSYAEAGFVDGASDAAGVLAHHAAPGAPRHHRRGHHPGHQCLERLFQPVYVPAGQKQNDPGSRLL